MVVSANLLSKGTRIKVGNNKCEVLDVKESIGLIRVEYKTPQGRLKSRTYAQNDQVKVV